MEEILCTRCGREFYDEATKIVFDPISRKHIKIENNICPECKTDAEDEDGYEE